MSENRKARFISATLAQLLATAALNEHRLHCQCEHPLPRVWDEFQWTTCRLCNRLLSQDEYEDRQ